MLSLVWKRKLLHSPTTGCRTGAFTCQTYILKLRPGVVGSMRKLSNAACMFFGLRHPCFSMRTCHVTILGRTQHYQPAVISVTWAHTWHAHTLCMIAARWACCYVCRQARMHTMLLTGSTGSIYKQVNGSVWTCPYNAIIHSAITHAHGLSLYDPSSECMRAHVCAKGLWLAQCIAFKLQQPLPWFQVARAPCELHGSCQALASHHLWHRPGSVA